MKTNNIESLLGPSGAFAGITVLLAGVVLTFSSVFGIILILVGAFAGFSCTAATIDPERRRVRFSTNYFGVFKSGAWTSVNDSMKLGILRTSLIWRVYSQGNRTADTTAENGYIVLYGSQGEPLMPLKKIKSTDTAETELADLCSLLGLEKR